MLVETHIKSVLRELFWETGGGLSEKNISLPRFCLFLKKNLDMLYILGYIIS